jgi:hypothetical protein
VSPLLTSYYLNLMSREKKRRVIPYRGPFLVESICDKICHQTKKVTSKVTGFVTTLPIM